MQVKIWGCRGSLPTPGPETVRYGGNTSCVEVSIENGTVLVLDAGSGIRPLGLELLRRGVRSVHLLLTHLHLDHLEGLRLFAPLFDEQATLEIWGPRSPLFSLQERIARAFSPPLFPIDLRRVPAAVRFHDVPRQPWAIDGASVSAELVVHPGPTLGFRIETASSSLAYLPDHEPALGGEIARTSSDWISCSCTTPSTAKANTASESAGATPASGTRSRSRVRPAWAVSSSSITTHLIRTRSSSGCKRMRERSPATTANHPPSHTKEWSSTSASSVAWK
jgi:Beta-lactamase superfamily domain